LKQNLNFDEVRILPVGSAFSFADLLFSAPQPWPVGELAVSDI
jgi:hypothetical protein